MGVRAIARIEMKIALHGAPAESPPFSIDANSLSIQVRAVYKGGI
jgi:hypothetical protein